MLLACAGTAFAQQDLPKTADRPVKISDASARPSKLQASPLGALSVKYSKPLPGGLKLQVLEGENGIKLKRIFDPGKENHRIDATRFAAVKAAAAGAEGVLNEGFDAYDGTQDWLPAGWTRQATSGLSYYNSWFVGEANENTPQPADGKYLAEIIYSDDQDQDEWLITPEVEVSEGYGLSFFAYFDPVYFFKIDEAHVDFSNYEFIKKEQAQTFQIMVSSDGGEWTVLKDYFEDYKDMTLRELMNFNGAVSLSRRELSLDQYVGHKVKFAFRYKGREGNSMFLDKVSVGYPELEPKYNKPTGSLFWGLDEALYLPPFSLAIGPVYTPLTWVNTTDNPEAQYEWSYRDADGNAQTADEENLTVTYKPDYSSEETTRNNFQPFPTLSASASGYSTGKYTAPYTFLQAGGKAEYIFQGDKVPSKFGLLTCDILTEGTTIMTQDSEDAGKAGIPIFGYNEETANWWTNHYFQGDQGPSDKVSVDAVINVFPASSTPTVIHGLWAVAKGQISDAANFKVGIYALDENFEPAAQPMAEASCKGSDVVVGKGGEQAFLTLPFTFDSPLAISDKDCAYYIVKLTGFNSDAVTYFAPMQSLLPAADEMAYGFIDLDIYYEGEKSHSFVPIANFEGDYGPCLNSFLFNLDAEYPWLQGGEDTFEAASGGGSKIFAVDSYYDASELTFTANTADGQLPAWLTAKVEGRYADAKVTFTVAPSQEQRSCEVTLSAPGVSKVFHISQNTATGIGSVSAGTANTVPAAVYDLTGRRVSNNAAHSQGVYVVKQADGKVVKVLR